MCDEEYSFSCGPPLCSCAALNQNEPCVEHSQWEKGICNLEVFPTPGMTDVKIQTVNPNFPLRRWKTRMFL